MTIDRRWRLGSEILQNNFILTWNHSLTVVHGSAVCLKHQASTPGSSSAAEGQGFRADHDQSRDVLVRDEVVNSGPAGVNYRVSSAALCQYLPS